MSYSKKKVLVLAFAAIMALVIMLGVALALPGGITQDVAVAADGDTVIQIAQSSVVHWSVKDVGSDLRDGSIYIYKYKDGGVLKEYYSVVRMSQAPNTSWTDWTLEQKTDVKISIMRYRGKDSSFNHEIELRGPLLNTGFTVEYINEGKYTAKADVPGRYEAKAVLTASEGYTFANTEAERATLTDRGINLEINPDGKQATMTKYWYVAEYDNALLNGSASIADSAEVEFNIPSWKFGEYTTIEYPWLYHGDGALREDMDLNEDYQVKVKNGDDYEEIIESIATPGRVRTVDLKPAWDPESEDQSNDIVTFYLTRLVDGVRVDITGQYRLRSEWSYYINQFMPAGDYELEIVVKDVILTTHKHWWDNTEHAVAASDLNSEAEYKGFTRKFNFSVLPGDLRITNDDILNQAGKADAVKRKIDLDTLIDLDNYADVFAQSEGKLQFEYALKYADVQANLGQTFWTTTDNIKLYFDEEPHLEYNLYRMKNDKYYAADHDIWSHYINTPSVYTVYYMAKMKNYASNPSMDDRYNSFYDVIVYKHIQTPTLNRNELYYTGGELSVQPKDDDLVNNRDLSLYTWTGNAAVEVGEYTVTFTFVHPDLYKWKGDKAYEFGENFELKWNIKPATVAVPEIADRVYRGGNNIKPAITVPTNQVLNKKIFTITYPAGHTDGNFKDAGIYEITLTLNDNNYVWETGDNDKDGIVTVNFTINPEENRWAVTPRIIQWEWRGYDKSINLIEGAAMFGVSHFGISFDAEGRKPVDGLEDFTIDSKGQVDSNIADRFYSLNSGTYYLIANVDKAQNWTALKSEAIRFEVAVARNYWESSPNIIRWKYDGFDATINLITAVPHFGETVTFSIISKRGATEADDVIVIDKLIINERGEAQGLTAAELAKLEGGKTYYLKAVVERKSAGFVDGDTSKPIYNYTQMSQYVEFHIQISNNYWTQTPNIERWIAGEEPSAPTGIPRWGEAVFVIYDEKTNEIIFNSNEDINKLAEAKPGWYRIEAMVEGNDNYTSLTSVTRFKVFATEMNFWNIIPNIQGWAEGQPHNVPIAKAAFGNITYSYYERADYENNGAYAKKLSGVPTVAGDYVMVAIAESDEHEDLTAVVKFSVYKTAAFSETTYIALVATFGAIIALGAALAVAYIIVQKKKMPKLAAANGDDIADDIADDEDEEIDEEEFESVVYEQNNTFEEATVSEVDSEIYDDTPALEPTSID
jgi:hypothetical protein